MTTQMPNVTLNNGVEMPIIGFGTYRIPLDQTQQAVEEAISVGYRHIDTASLYRNEREVGRAIAASGLPREDFFVTTKVWIDSAGESGARKSFEASLERLGLTYVDLYLVHQPFGDYFGSWRTLQSLAEQHLTRSIGVSNFFPDRLLDLIIHSGVTPAVNQIETHPYFQRTADQELMKAHGVQHESWGGFADARNDVLRDPVLKAIADHHEKSIAQVVLRWLVQRDIVSIPKSTRPERMKENLAVFDFKLSAEEMARISELETGTSAFFDHHDPAQVERLGNWKLDD